LYNIRVGVESVSMNTEVVEKYPLEFHKVVKREDCTAVTSIFSVDEMGLNWKQMHVYVCLCLLPG
jgi:hypothetical protein